MNEYFDLLQKLQDMNPEDALTEIEKILAEQGDNPDDDIILLKAQILYTLALKEENFDYAHQVISILEPLLDKFRFETYYTKLLHIVCHCYIILEWFDNAETYAELYHECANDNASAFMLAHVYSETHKDLEKALALVNRFLESGDFLAGADIKIKILINLKRFDEIPGIINYGEQAYPSQIDFWNEKRFLYFAELEDFDNAVKLLDNILIENDDENKKQFVFYNKCLLLKKYKSEEELLSFMHEFSAKHPDDAYIYAHLGKYFEPKNLDTSIDYYEKAFKHDRDYIFILLSRYLKRGTKQDAEKYFGLTETILNGDIDEIEFGFIKDTAYSSFYKYDNGQCIKLLEKYLSEYPEHECSYSLLGKIYESGIGTLPDSKKAFEYYETAYNLNADCGCGPLFYSYAKYYGIGTETDKETAKKIILKIIKERQEADRFILYAIFAFDTEDSRFDKLQATEYLKNYEDALSAAFLLYKYSETEEEKSFYWEHFKELFDTTEPLEQDYFRKYLDNPSLPFVPFVNN